MLGNKKSDGYQHARLTIRFTPFAIFLGAVVGYLLKIDPLLGAILGGLGCLAGLFVEPDLDQTIVSSSEWRAVRLFGPIGALWVGYWFNYALTFGGFWIKHPYFHHRGLSHWPVIGTLTRIVWLVPLYCLFDYAISRLKAYFGLQIHLQVLPEHVLIVMIGLIVSDISHWGRDFLDWKA